MAISEWSEPTLQRESLSVSQLTYCIKEALEATFPLLWVSGELSDVSRPQSGHIYLTLKDEHAQIKGVIWRSVACRLPFELEDGQEVLCLAEVSVYPPRGTYQLVIRQVEPRGLGALQLALRQLQQRLACEGLFDPQHKKPLPRFPRCIGLVTSPTGAAVRDFLEVVRRRWEGVHVCIFPCRVQGPGAAEEISAAIQTANRMQPAPEVLVVTRGGGSLEDLWCFNEECVVRAIFASEIPVVSAVGHEIDVSLADLVADVRALTPTEAAERVVPSCDDVLAGLRSAEQRLAAALRARAGTARSRLEMLAQHRVFRRPYEPLFELERRLDELDERAQRAVQRQWELAQQRFSVLAGQIESLSPLAVLARGYSLTQRAETGETVRDAKMLQPGERLITRLAEGRVVSRVEQVETEEPS